MVRITFGHLQYILLSILDFAKPFLALSIAKVPEGVGFPSSNKTQFSKITKFIVEKIENWENFETKSSKRLWENFTKNWENMLYKSSKNNLREEDTKLENSEPVWKLTFLIIFFYFHSFCGHLQRETKINFSKFHHR